MDVLGLKAFRPASTIVGSSAFSMVSLTKEAKAASVPLAPTSPIATGSHSCRFVKRDSYGVWPTILSQSLCRATKVEVKGDILGTMTSGAPA